METSSRPEPVSVGNWMLTSLIMVLPVVNLVMLFVWAFGKSTPPSKANWAKAALIWLAIVLGLWLLTALLMAAGLFALQSGGGA